MIKPTVGRVVWFRPGPDHTFFGGRGEQPLAAIVAFVHDDHLVNLAVFDENGQSRTATSVQLVQDGDAFVAGSRYCEWMPYQKGQAAKTEAAEAKLAGSAA